MANRSYKASIVIVALTSLALVLGAEIVSRAAPVFVVASGLGILAAAAYAWVRFQRPKRADARFGALLKGALVFACGSAYGVIEWSRDGWRVMYLPYLLIPVAIAVYLFWAALKAKQKAGGTDAP